MQVPFSGSLTSTFPTQVIRNNLAPVWGLKEGLEDETSKETFQWNTHDDDEAHS